MWQLPIESTQPIYQQIVVLILDHIKVGRLLPGEKIPAERQLAQVLGVNRSTIVHAFDELEAMGVIIRKQGSGTRINNGKWGIYTGGTTDWRHYLAKGTFSQQDPYVKKLKEKLVTETEPLIDGYSGDLPLSLIPTLELPTISWRDFLSEEQFVDELGYLPLRMTIINKLKKEQGLELTSDQLLVTAGAQQALYLIIQVLLKSGDSIAIEEPSSFYHLPIFQDAGIRLFGIPMDHHGMRVEYLEEQIIRQQLKLVLVNPNMQNPTGTTMSEQRRRKLIDLCQKYQIPIVEDDVFSEVLFNQAVRPKLLKELDNENVIYLGSLSKVLGATTKIGWLSAPVRVIKQLALAQQELDFSLSIFPQVLANSALTNDNYQQEITLLRQRLIVKRNDLIAALKKELGTQVKLLVPQGGYYLWVENVAGSWQEKAFEQLLEDNILISPGSLFGVDQQKIRINYARLSQEECQLLAQKLKEIT